MRNGQAMVRLLLIVGCAAHASCLHVSPPAARLALRGGGGPRRGLRTTLQCEPPTVISERRSESRSMRPVEYTESRAGESASITRRPSTGSGASPFRLHGVASECERMLRVTFLPVGFPRSVASEYAVFQGLNLAQDFTSNLRGILSTQKILQGIGVGRADVTAMAATMQMYLRDACSMLGGLLFGSLASGKFEGNIKRWRMFADAINDVAMTMDMVAPLFPTHFLLLICISSVFKAICGVSAGACNAAITQHLAVSGNVADVGRSNGAQHTVVQMVGIFVGLLLGKWAEAGVAARVWGLFAVLTFIHLVANLLALQCLTLRTLNRQRLSLVLTDWLASNARECRTPEEICKEERILWNSRHAGASWPDMVFGASVAMAEHDGRVPVLDLVRVFSGEKFMAVLLKKGRSSAKRRVGIILSDNHSPRDLIMGFLCAKLLWDAWRRSNASEQGIKQKSLAQLHQEAATEAKRLFPALEKSLSKAGWQVDQVHLGVPKWVATW